VFDAPSSPSETLSVLFWLTWLVLFYLAWPRLFGIIRRFLFRHARGKPVKLIVAPARPTWDLVLEKYLVRGTLLFLGLSILELFLRRPALERFSLPLLAICLTLTFILRWWRNYFRQSLEPTEIVFPQVSDNTALGLRLLKVQDLLEKLRQIAAKLDKKGAVNREVAAQLRALLENVRRFLLDIRFERPDSPILRQARSLFIRLEPLADSFELLLRLPHEAEVRGLSNDLVDILSRTKSGFEALRLAQGEELVNQIDTLISVLRYLHERAI
jgi:hypothetical protein